MAEYAIDFNATCREESDGSKTVVLLVSGLPDVGAANMVSGWLRKAIQDNANLIGRREPNVKPQ